MRRVTLFLFILLGAYLALGVLYSLVTPVLEASDEISHYPVVKHIADGRGLPVQDPGVETLWHQEGSQPPLYYAVAAALTAWIDTDDLQTLMWINPLANIGKPLAPGNKNMVIHTSQEAFPWGGAVLAIHLIRFFSLLLATGTVYLTYRLAREIAPQRADMALVAAALVAFNPMFLFIAGSVNNDNLVVLLATFVVWLLARTLREGKLPVGRLVALGVALGLAALTKLSGLALLPLAVGALFVVAARRRDWRSLSLWCVVLGTLVAAIAGWWYVRNWRLYGDPTGLNMMLAIAGRRAVPWTLARIPREFEGFRMSYWGVFGGFNIIAWPWLYRFYDLLVLAGLAGWGGWLLRRRHVLQHPAAPRLALLFAWLSIVVLALIRWTSQTYASQGRLIFPAIGAVSVLTTYGWAGLLPNRWRTLGLGAITAVLGAFAVVVPLLVIVPAYAAPPILAAEQVPAAARQVNVTHGGVLRMLAYELPKDTVRPGEYVPVTVYWEATAATERNLAVFVHLLGRNREQVGNLGTYLGLGAYPTSLLRPGDIVKDTYQVLVAPTAVTPSLLRVDVGLFESGDGHGEAGEPAVTLEGQPAETILGAVRLLPHSAPRYDIEQPAQVDFGGQALLLGHSTLPESVQPGDVLSLMLYWQAEGRMTEDYHVFVHLTNQESPPVAQGDKAPADGDWPTWAWEPAYPIADSYSVLVPPSTPPGIYEVRVGLYRLRDFWRVPVQGDSSASYTVLGRVQVR